MAISKPHLPHFPNGDDFLFVLPPAAAAGASVLRAWTMASVNESTSSAAEVFLNMSGSSGGGGGGKSKSSLSSSEPVMMPAVRALKVRILINTEA